QEASRNGGNDRVEEDVRHRTMMGLLGAYVDEEVAGGVKAEVEAHLQRCEECRRELRIQLALRTRLLAEERSAPPAAVLERLETHLNSLGVPDVSPARPLSGRLAELTRRARPYAAWSGRLVAASIATPWIG